MKDYSRIACPNASCSLFSQRNAENIIHRSWTGKNKDIERLKCHHCAKEFSERKGTLMECAKISDDKQELMLKCFKWGVVGVKISSIFDNNYVSMYNKFIHTDKSL